MSLVISSWLRCRLGMIDPGFSPGGLRSHLRKFTSSRSKIDPANTLRCRRWVRLGPTVPAEYPLTEWQLAQPLALKRSAPAAASPEDGATTGVTVSLARAQAAKSPSVWAMTRSRMLAWDRPQNSEHWP